VNPGVKHLVKLGEKWTTALDDIGDEEKIKERFASDPRYDEEIDGPAGRRIDHGRFADRTDTRDKSAANLISIAFIGEFDGKKVPVCC
jgi:hypothetical protein